MDLRIADTFADRSTKMTGDEQKAVKATAFDLRYGAAPASGSPASDWCRVRSGIPE
jgi:hypothetical protein